MRKAGESMSDMDLPLAVRMMQDGYLMQIDQLQAENESLRKELAVTNPLFETLNDANDRLIYENAKLRELVRRMFYAVHPVDREKFLTNVAELGVEV